MDKYAYTGEATQKELGGNAVQSARNLNKIAFSIMDLQDAIETREANDAKLKQQRQDAIDKDYATREKKAQSDYDKAMAKYNKQKDHYGNVSGNLKEQIGLVKPKKENVPILTTDSNGVIDPKSVNGLKNIINDIMTDPKINTDLANALMDESPVNTLNAVALADMKNNEHEQNKKDLSNAVDAISANPDIQSAYSKSTANKLISYGPNTIKSKDVTHEVLRSTINDKGVEDGTLPVNPEERREVVDSRLRSLYGNKQFGEFLDKLDSDTSHIATKAQLSQDIENIQDYDMPQSVKNALVRNVLLKVGQNPSDYNLDSATLNEVRYRFGDNNLNKILLESGGVSREASYQATDEANKMMKVLTGGSTEDRESLLHQYGYDLGDEDHVISHIKSTMADTSNRINATNAETDAQFKDYYDNPTNYVESDLNGNVKINQALSVMSLGDDNITNHINYNNMTPSESVAHLVGSSVPGSSQFDNNVGKLIGSRTIQKLNDPNYASDELNASMQETTQLASDNPNYIANGKDTLIIKKGIGIDVSDNSFSSTLFVDTALLNNGKHTDGYNNAVSITIPGLEGEAGTSSFTLGESIQAFEGTSYASALAGKNANMKSDDLISLNQAVDTGEDQQFIKDLAVNNPKLYGEMAKTINEATYGTLYMSARNEKPDGVIHRLLKKIGFNLSNDTSDIASDDAIVNYQTVYDEADDNTKNIITQIRKSILDKYRDHSGITNVPTGHGTSGTAYRTARNDDDAIVLTDDKMISNRISSVLDKGKFGYVNPETRKFVIAKEDDPNYRIRYSHKDMGFIQITRGSANDPLMDENGNSFVYADPKLQKEYTDAIRNNDMDNPIVKRHDLVENSDTRLAGISKLNNDKHYNEIKNGKYAEDVNNTAIDPNTPNVIVDAKTGKLSVDVSNPFSQIGIKATITAPKTKDSFLKNGLAVSEARWKIQQNEGISSGLTAKELDTRQFELGKRQIYSAGFNDNTAIAIDKKTGYMIPINDNEMDSINIVTKNIGVGLNLNDEKALVNGKPATSVSDNELLKFEKMSGDPSIGVDEICSKYAELYKRIAYTSGISDYTENMQLRQLVVSANSRLLHTTYNQTATLNDMYKAKKAGATSITDYGTNMKKANDAYYKANMSQRAQNDAKLKQKDPKEAKSNEEQVKEHKKIMKNNDVVGLSLYTPNGKTINNLTNRYEEFKTGEAMSLIKGKEGFSKDVYRDQGELAIGYGIRGVNPLTGDKIRGDMHITKKEAEAMLNKKIQDNDKSMFSILRKHGAPPLNDRQMIGIRSAMYNLGLGLFYKKTEGKIDRTKPTKFAKALYRADYKTASEELKGFDYAGGKENKGLKIRREKEASYIY